MKSLAIVLLAVFITVAFGQKGPPADGQRGPPPDGQNRGGPPHGKHHGPPCHGPWSEEQKKSFEECKQELGEPSESEGPKNHACMKACVMEKMGEIQDLKLNEATIMSEMEKRHNKQKETVQSCVQEVSSQTFNDKCELSEAFGKCMHEKNRPRD